MLEKERLKGIESQQIGSAGKQKVHCEILVLEETNETERSCGFKTNDFCMIAGTSQDDEQALDFVKEKELNLKSVHINAEIARSQKEKEAEGSYGNMQQNIEAEEEGPSDDWSTTSEGVKNCVKFPNSTPTEIVELYRKLDLQRRELEKQRIYTQDELLKEKDNEIVMNDSQETESKDVRMIQQIEGVHYCEPEQGKILETNDMEERLADNLIENLNQHTDVLTKELNENSKQHTEMFPKEEEALKPCIFNSDNSYVNYAGKGGQQMENVRESNEKETMLAKNIVKDHHSIMVIGTMEITLEVGKKYSKDFLSLERDLELQEEDLVTGSLNKTIGYCDFEIDSLTVFTDIAEYNPSLRVVLNEDEMLQ